MTRVKNIVFEKLPQEGRERVYIESAIANQIKIQNQPKSGDPFRGLMIKMPQAIYGWRFASGKKLPIRPLKDTSYI
jgi:hypothetical protein